MIFRLTHIAEALFADIINSHRHKFAALAGIENLVDPTFFGHEPVVAHAEVPLNQYRDKIFDGASRIDCLVRVQSRLGVAFELKLGKTRLSRKRVKEEWLQECRPSHDQARWSGNMMAILDRRIQDPETNLYASVVGSEPIEVHRSWVVVTHRKVAESWREDPPILGEHARLMAFEDIADLPGSPDGFDAIVRRQLPESFYDEWIGES